MVYSFGLVSFFGSLLWLVSFLAFLRLECPFAFGGLLMSWPLGVIPPAVYFFVYLQIVFPIEVRQLLARRLQVGPLRFHGGPVGVNPCPVFPGWFRCQSLVTSCPTP